MVGILIAIGLFGALGGLFNAYLTDGGFRAPGTVDSGDGTIWKPGWIGNVLMGAATAGFSWAFYGPFAGYVVLGDQPSDQGEMALTLGAVAMAFLVGVGGAKLLSSYVDKELFKATALKLASKVGRTDAVTAIASSRPAEALEYVRNMT